MMELKNLSCAFSGNFFSKDKFTAVSPLNTSFRKGGRYAIVGESGSGKTTLARMMAGLQKPSGGNVFVEETPVYGKNKSPREHFKKVQLIQQNSLSALDPKMTVGRSIEEPLVCFFHMNKALRRKRCEELMELCSLPADCYSRYPDELSGGEQKRVAIARALAVQPKCLIFDEATNGFDLPLRKKITEDILLLQDSMGFTAIFITHDIELAVSVAEEILVMRASQLLEKVRFSGDISVFKDEYSKLLLKASWYKPLGIYQRNNTNQLV
ncbi:ABC transporter ATP-binding protein [Ruminiclostridium hungatei]|nr:dipeptide/oligopeptide/nickel ABC transporter ATP-binding protein [Ruminiclostridium hungatei]